MADLPADVRDLAERLTRRARAARGDEEAAAHRRRRDELLAEHGYVARVREEDTREVLVLYPDDWVDEEDVVRTERIEDVDRAVERQIAGAADPDDWDAIEAHNRAVVEQVRERHGDDHGDNAAAFADYVGNHLAKRLGRATPGEVEVFLEEYYPRNVWPSDDQAAVVEESVELALSLAREHSPDV